MLINVTESEESRVAVIDDGGLDELYVERLSLVSHVGNIYKGKVVNIEPGIQAAFVDFGLNKNGFLHISDVEPSYYRQGGYGPNGRKLSDSGKEDSNDADGRRPYSGGLWSKATRPLRVTAR